MADSKQKASCACRKCLKGASAFLKTQITLLRVNGCSSEISAAIGKLRACIKILNETGSSASDTVSGDDARDVLFEGKTANAPVKALKLGAYVKNYFSWLSASGVELPAATINEGLSLQWSRKNLNLWCPLFATKETLTENERTGHRFWSMEFIFAGRSLFINSQWYGNQRGKKQKAGFDEFAVKLAGACGLSFTPYALPGIPESKSEPDEVVSSRGRKDNSTASSGNLICITSMKKKTFRFKG